MSRRDQRPSVHPPQDKEWQRGLKAIQHHSMPNRKDILLYFSARALRVMQTFTPTGSNHSLTHSFNRMTPKLCSNGPAKSKQQQKYSFSVGIICTSPCSVKTLTATYTNGNGKASKCSNPDRFKHYILNMLKLVKSCSDAATLIF